MHDTDVLRYRQDPRLRIVRARTYGDRGIMLAHVVVGHPVLLDIGCASARVGRRLLEYAESLSDFPGVRLALMPPAQVLVVPKSVLSWDRRRGLQLVRKTPSHGPPARL
jgi:hypothetical protein